MRPQSPASVHPLVFIHTYPDDLKGDGEAQALNCLIAAHDVALVDMGHTHYNELANNGRTIFAASRSTGQIEEGPVGYSVITFDRGNVGWRFKPLDESFPFVASTLPVDHRILRESADAVADVTDICAMVFGHRAVSSVTCRFASGEPTLMTWHDQSELWTCQLPALDPNLTMITVEAIDQSGRIGQQTILVAGPCYVAPKRQGVGSDADSIGAWPENGILATQLGPNRNAKPSQL